MDYRRFLLEAYDGRARACAEMCGRVGRCEGHALPCDVAFVD